MKKIFKFLPIAALAIFCLSLSSCSDDKDEPVAIVNLPQTAKSFIESYYPSVTIVSATMDKNDYDVVLSNGHKIEFDKSGNWIEVEAPKGQTIPNNFYPSQIDIYVGLTYVGAGINSISKTASGYEVELVSGLELLFNADGNFVSIAN